MKRLFLCIVTLMSVIGVSAQSRMERVEYQESSARNIEPQQSVMIAPLIADLEIISDKIYYTEVDAFKNYEVTLAIVQFIPDFKKVALSRAARHYSADVIVGATVDVITNSSGKIEITISGYPARYTNFRNATSEEVSLVGAAKSVCDDDIGILRSADSRTDITIQK
ncbi:MAG: hypothetical protein IJ464_05685 [Alistipes sp.]|nr:hypothetical protein [Alistipes sp.]